MLVRHNTHTQTHTDRHCVRMVCVGADGKCHHWSAVYMAVALSGGGGGGYSDNDTRRNDENGRKIHRKHTVCVQCRVCCIICCITSVVEIIVSHIKSNQIVSNRYKAMPRMSHTHRHRHIARCACVGFDKQRNGGTDRSRTMYTTRHTVRCSVRMRLHTFTRIRNT